MKITVAGVGYVGLSLAVLLAQKHEVTAITTTEAKAEKLNKLSVPSRMMRLNDSSVKLEKVSVFSIFARQQIKPLPMLQPIL